MTSQAFTLATAAGTTLHGLVDLPPEPGPRPVVVVCHGFKGFMEWGFFPPMAELLANRGFTVARFNFSGAGMRPGDERVTDPAAFRSNTFRREREELLAVLGAVGSEIAPGRADADRLGLLGHSRGGAAVLFAAAGEWRERLRALVTWASIGRLDRLGAEQMAEWRRRGELPVVNARTGQELAVGPQLLAEIEEGAADLDLTAAAGRRRAPWLIVHGDEDESVPVAEGRDLEGAAAPPRELLVIPGGGHTLGASHPFAGPTPELIAALNATQTWFRRHL
jgi:uncharacterized protein